MAKKAKKQGFSVEGFDTRHYRQTEEYVHAIDRLYDTAIHSFSRLAGSVKVDPDKPFDFASRPAFQRRAQEIVNELANSMSAVIQHGTEEQWLYACKKNDAFLAHIMDTSKIGKRQLNKMQDKNLDALAAFQERKVGGLDLSQRVWQYAGQTKGLMELGIDIAVGDGRSAEELSRDLREYLQEPDKLFRRVRDKHGNLVLSKRAAAYHPGLGVYRSSYKNAMRLARTEINMAYRDSDRYRWNNMDFIVGYRVHLSNNHTLNGKPFKDICDELAGDYPKDFVFKGWHPNCRCFVTPILQDPDEFNTDELNEMKAAFYGTEYKKFQSRNTPSGVPKGFKQWVKKHKEESLNWRKQPYWIKDNFKGGTLAGSLVLKKPTIPKPKAPEKMKWSDLSKTDQNKYMKMWNEIFDELYYTMIAMKDVYHIDISLLQSYRDKAPDEYWNIDAAKAEKDRLIQEFDKVADRMKIDGERLKEEAINVSRECSLWSNYAADPDMIEIFCNGFKSDRWPKYPDMFDELKKDIEKGRKDMQNGKDSFNSAVYDCGVVIKKAKAKGIEVTALETLSNTKPTEAKNAPALVREMRTEINRVEDLIDKQESGPSSELDGVIDVMKQAKVEYREVKKLEKELTKDQIVARVGGGDLTQGSCSSLAFTYAGNRCGLDVLDYRDGTSRSMFSRSSNIMEIANKVGGIVSENKNDFTNAHALLKNVKANKEYYFTCGAHAAIVRKTESGFEYLELQSATDNGFKPLNDTMLKWRFGAKKSHSVGGYRYATKECLIDIDLLRGNDAFRRLLGYINTSEDKQRKGSRGTRK